MEQEKQEDESVNGKSKHVSGLVTAVSLIGVVLFVIFIFNVSEQDTALSPVISNEDLKSRCLPVPAVIAQRLNDGLNINGGGSIRNLQAVKSNDFESVYFISGDLQGSGLEGEGDIATFATNKMDETGLTLSVDAVATEFSDWPDVSTTNLGVSMGDDGYNESRKCATGS